MKKERFPIPELGSIEQIADFWDTHSTADYDDFTHKVQFAVSLPQKEPVHLIPALSHRLTEKLFEVQR